MANGDTNIHPGQGNGKGAKLIEIAKGNPIAAFLFAMLLLGLIMPPRRRKYRKSKKYSYKRWSKSQKKTSKKRTKKSKKTRTKRTSPSVKKTKPIRSRKTSKTLPAYRIKGSKAAIEHMAKLRANRKKIIY